jgi:hypothetical protein
MNPLSAVKTLFGIDASLEKLTGELARLAAADEALHREWDGLLTADPVQSDVEAGARRVLIAARAALVTRIRSGVSRAFAGDFVWGGNEPITRTAPSEPLELHNLSPFEMQLLTNLEGLVQASTALASPDGVPLDERARRLAAIPGERATIQRQHSELVDRAAELGIQVAHLPEVVAQRNAARHARERAEHGERDRAYHQRLTGR